MPSLNDASNDTIVRTLSPSLTLRGAAIASGLSTFDPDVFEAGTFDVSDLNAFLQGQAPRAEYGDPVVNSDAALGRSDTATSPNTQLYDLAVS